MFRTLGNNNSELGKMAPQRVDNRRPLAHEKIACSEHNGCSLAHLAFTVTKRMVGRNAASQIASASAASFLCRFTKSCT